VSYPDFLGLASGTTLFGTLACFDSRRTRSKVLRMSVWWLPVSRARVSSAFQFHCNRQPRDIDLEKPRRKLPS
jgi:hypothetical protein